MAHEKLVSIHWKNVSSTSVFIPSCDWSRVPYHSFDFVMLQSHAPGTKRIKLDTPEDIAKWREERRKSVFSFFLECGYSLRQLRSNNLPLQELPNISKHWKEEKNDRAARGDGSCSGNSTVWVCVHSISSFLYFIVCAFLFWRRKLPWQRLLEKGKSQPLSWVSSLSCLETSNPSPMTWTRCQTDYCKCRSGISWDPVVKLQLLIKAPQWANPCVKFTHSQPWLI